MKCRACFRECSAARRPREELDPEFFFESTKPTAYDRFTNAKSPRGRGYASCGCDFDKSTQLFDVHQASVSNIRNQPATSHRGLA